MRDNSIPDKMEYPVFIRNKFMNILFFFVICGILFSSPVTSNSTSPDPFFENTIAAQHIQVSNCTINPAVLMPGDQATVTILLTNTGTDTGVGINSASISSEDIHILSSKYGKVGSIGPSNSMSFTYTLKAGDKNGIYYPVFSTEFRGTYFLRYPFKVEVQDIPLDASIFEKPNTWADDKKEKIILHVGNRRDNELTGIIIVPHSGPHEVFPASYIIGTLTPGEVREVPFNVTPHGEGPIDFAVEYKNGINIHNTSCTLPLTIGKNKKEANLFISNVDITSTGEHIRVKGDVSNSGLETANGVTVTSKNPAEPVFPNKEYGVGILKASEFSNFEVTFTAPLNCSEVPLVTSFKDADGRIISTETQVNISSASVMNMTDLLLPGEEPDLLPGVSNNSLQIGVLLLVILIGFMLYWRRKQRYPTERVTRMGIQVNGGNTTPLQKTGTKKPQLPDGNHNRFQEGIKLYQQEDFVKAAEIFHQIVVEDRMNHRAWNAYGICLTRLKEYQAAHDCYENALMLEPGNMSYERNKDRNEVKSQES